MVGFFCVRKAFEGFGGIRGDLAECFRQQGVGIDWKFC